MVYYTDSLVTLSVLAALKVVLSTHTQCGTLVKYIYPPCVYMYICNYVRHLWMCHSIRMCADIWCHINSYLYICMIMMLMMISLFFLVSVLFYNGLFSGELHLWRTICHLIPTIINWLSTQGSKSWLEQIQELALFSLVMTLIQVLGGCLMERERYQISYTSCVKYFNYWCLFCLLKSKIIWRYLELWFSG